MFLHPHVILFTGGVCIQEGVCILEGLHPRESASRDGSGRPPPDTTGYGQRAGGTHPTALHSCFCFAFFIHGVCAYQCILSVLTVYLIACLFYFILVWLS